MSVSGNIARGGIRIVRSTHLQNYLSNSDLIFDENYNLAFTQQKKNKDLAEGGSKGAILLNWGAMDKSESSFRQYIDGLLDLMLPDDSVIDYYQKPVILFLGPDEGLPNSWNGRPCVQGPRVSLLEGVLYRQAGKHGRHPPRPLRHDDQFCPPVTSLKLLTSWGSKRRTSPRS